MSFQAYDSDPQNGAPIDLYEIIAGDVSYKYTNCVRDIAGYKAVAIQRDTIKTSGKTDKYTLQLRLPVDTDLANTFLPYPPPFVCKCIIRQMHLSDPDQEQLVVWTGRVTSSGRENHEAVLSIDNTILSFKRPGLNRNFQWGCPLPLYGSRCKADKDSHKVVVAVQSVADNGSLVFPALWYQPFDWAKFRSGTIQWQSSLGTETRTIIQVTENSILFSGFLREVEAGTQVTMYLGCRHDMDDCRYFNNINNYGGQPWIPFKNPVKQHPFW